MIFLVLLDIFIITTALPTITIELTILDAGYAWISSAYMLAFSTVVLI